MESKYGRPCPHHVFIYALYIQQTSITSFARSHSTAVGTATGTCAVCGVRGENGLCACVLALSSFVPIESIVILIRLSILLFNVVLCAAIVTMFSIIANVLLMDPVSTSLKSRVIKGRMRVFMLMSTQSEGAMAHRHMGHDGLSHVARHDLWKVCPQYNRTLSTEPYMELMHTGHSSFAMITS